VKVVAESGKGQRSLQLPKGLVISRQQDSEAKSDNQGFVSKVVGGAKKVTNFLSKVPVVGEIAGTVGGVLDTIGDVASFFGFSRPVDLDKVTFVESDPYRHQMNCVGRDTSSRLSLNPDSHIENIKGWSGVDTDEMNFNFLKGIPTYTGSFTISTTDVANTQIYKESVTPLEQYMSVTETGASGVAVTLNSYGPMGFLGQYFENWRGSMTYTFKFVKTEFHSCRLLFVFTPCATSDVTNAQSDYCIREIVDIRTDSEVTITVPWLLPYSYAKVRALDDDSQHACSGTLIVRVLNPLQCPETCAQNMEVLVYQSAGTDFEYAGLVQGWNYPAVLAEAGCLTTRSEMMSNSSSPNFTNEHNLAVMGDAFVSIKQLLNMYCRVSMKSDAPADKFQIYPYAYTFTKAPITTGPAAFNYSAFGRDYFNELSQGFTLARGGVTLNLVSMDPKYEYSSAMLVPMGNQTIFGLLSVDPFANGNTGPTPVGFAGGSYPSFTGPSAVFARNRAALDITVPHGCRNAVKIIRPEWMDFNTATFVVTDSGVLQDQSQYTVYVSRNTTATLGNIFRRGADDYCVGYFVGFPCLGFTYISVIVCELCLVGCGFLSPLVF